MRSAQIEKWALDVMDRVQAKLPIEDARVEVKAKWIPAQRAARRIAAHANAARGEPVLWLIGVDEKKGEIIGAEREELANWFSAVEAEFDGLAPALTDMVVPIDGKVVIALLFETDRAPFVVRNPKGTGVATLEVPWREGTKTRSAKRSDLIRVLVPVQRIPDMEVLGGELIVEPQTDGQLGWSLSMELYVVPMTDDRIVVPKHRCECDFEVVDIQQRTPMKIRRLSPPKKMAFRRTAADPPPRTLSETVRSTATELLIYGPGLVGLSAWTPTQPLQIVRFATDANVYIKLPPVHVDRPISIQVSLKLFGTTGEDDKALCRWRLAEGPAS